ncbi:hypothetical protein RBG61_09010 [Paludicola sp. MB14-C6]|uniref:hypothetical protein n=1 Tax=Paludihabitans sp. MB14-C6 TaxID=3070656 RepID=UPI0027DAF0C6|nr:hypothetical protein [Paludicola sp. MB14-C6]WMJ22139.1 hypothetical protein RBG61_09010 [Paludicola sp. MB14-C6]
MKEMKNKTFIIWGVILVVAIVGLTVLAFQKGSSPPHQISTNLSKPFDAKATVKMKDLVMVCDINKSAVGACTIKIQEPKQLKDMEFQYDGKDIKVSYKGLSVKLDENSKLASSLAAVIVNSIDTAASPSGVDVKMVGKTVQITGKSDSGNFKIVLDKASGSIMTLTLPQLDFECNFDDFIFKK